MKNDFTEAKLKKLEDLCHSHRIPLTVQRRMILETLASRTDHPTADELYDAVKVLVKGVSRTTVYRVLDTFLRLGMVIRVSNPQAKAHFDADTTRHHHLICLKCDAISDYHHNVTGGVELPRMVADGFVVEDFSLNITGFCAACHAAETAGSAREKKFAEAGEEL